MTVKRTPTIDLTSGVPDEEPEQTVAITNIEAEPVLPGFEMMDDDSPEEPSPRPIHIEDYKADAEIAHQIAHSVTGKPADAVPLTGEILTPQPRIPSQGIVYESRIRVLEAWQYPGHLPKDTPKFVDRNWVGWASHDPLRKKDESPCLRVPMDGRPHDVVICRPGDFVVRQEIQLGPGLPSDIKVEVWEEEQFARLFMPVPAIIKNENDQNLTKPVKSTRRPKPEPADA